VPTYFLSTVIGEKPPGSGPEISDATSSQVLGCWPDLNDRLGDIIQIRASISLALLECGMQSRRPSVTIRIDLPDGHVVLTDTAWEC
jgi:hypothetical protein